MEHVGEAACTEKSRPIKSRAIPVAITPDTSGSSGTGASYREFMPRDALAFPNRRSLDGRKEHEI